MLFWQEKSRNQQNSSNILFSFKMLCTRELLAIFGAEESSYQRFFRKGILQVYQALKRPS